MVGAWRMFGSRRNPHLLRQRRSRHLLPELRGRQSYRQVIPEGALRHPKRRRFQHLRQDLQSPPQTTRRNPPNPNGCNRHSNRKHERAPQVKPRPFSTKGRSLIPPSVIWLRAGGSYTIARIPRSDGKMHAAILNERLSWIRDPPKFGLASAFVERPRQIHPPAL